MDTDMLDFKIDMIRKTTTDYRKLSNFFNEYHAKDTEENCYPSIFNGSTYPGFESNPKYNYNVRIYAETNEKKDVIFDDEGDTYYYSRFMDETVFIGSGGDDIIRITQGGGTIELGSGSNIVVYDSISGKGNWMIKNFDYDDKIFFIGLAFNFAALYEKVDGKIVNLEDVHNFIVSKLNYVNGDTWLVMSRGDEDKSLILIEDMAPEDFEVGQFIF